jgi:hypothetical protein
MQIASSKTFNAKPSCPDQQDRYQRFNRHLGRDCWRVKFPIDAVGAARVQEHIPMIATVQLADPSYAVVAKRRWFHRLLEVVPF